MPEEGAFPTWDRERIYIKRLWGAQEAVGVINENQKCKSTEAKKKKKERE